VLSPQINVDVFVMPFVIRILGEMKGYAAILRNTNCNRVSHYLLFSFYGRQHLLDCLTISI